MTWIADIKHTRTHTHTLTLMEWKRYYPLLMIWCIMCSYKYSTLNIALTCSIRFYVRCGSLFFFSLFSAKLKEIYNFKNKESAWQMQLWLQRKCMLIYNKIILFKNIPTQNDNMILSRTWLLSLCTFLLNSQSTIYWLQIEDFQSKVI